MVGNIFFERRGGFIFPAFYFNGDNLSAVLQHKINFTIFVREIAGSDFKLPTKLLQTVVFSQSSFELVVSLQKDCAVVDTGHVLEKSGVEDMRPVVTSKRTYIAPYINAEGPQYLVVEDHFPNGRPPLEEGGVYMTDRDTVNRS